MELNSLKNSDTKNNHKFIFEEIREGNDFESHLRKYRSPHFDKDQLKNHSKILKQSISSLYNEDNEILNDKPMGKISRIIKTDNALKDDAKFEDESFKIREKEIKLSKNLRSIFNWRIDVKPNFGKIRNLAKDKKMQKLIDLNVSSEKSSNKKNRSMLEDISSSSMILESSDQTMELDEDDERRLSAPPSLFSTKISKYV